MFSPTRTPRRAVVFAALCLGAFLAPSGFAAAEGPSAPRIEKGRVGLPAGPEINRSRRGAWAPVYVTLQPGDSGNGPDGLALVVEASDSDDARYHYTVPVPARAGGAPFEVITYVRPGAFTSEFSVSLRKGNGQVVQSVTVPLREADGEVLAPADYLYLTVGSRLPGLKQSLLPPKPQDNPAEPEPTDEAVRSLAFIDSVGQMPDRWFGYEAVDVVILPTGRKDFVEKLAAPAALPQRQALAEWVRRGGRLVIAVGANHQLVADLLQRFPLPGQERGGLLNCAIQGSFIRKELSNVVARWIGYAEPLLNVEIARLAPGPGTDVLLRDAAVTGDAEERPLVVQSACGLGRVVLVGLDLDAGSFTTWGGQKAFWERLQRELGLRSSAPGRAAEEPRAERRELGVELQRDLETLADVPVISFGWVAFFILLYIALIGPLDYFLLKKVFKRLEFTWITFPFVVLIVSVAAYFTAYRVKGDDLRINRVELVEFDLHNPQVYGTTWLTLFSPQVQNYTLGVAPAAPEWATTPTASAPSTTLTVLERPDRAGRTGSAVLSQRAYDYAPDAAGLEGVPIPQWSARSFAARWQAPLDPARSPIEADVALSRLDPTLLAGTITNHLPVDLHDVTLFYRGQAYSLGTLPRAGGFRQIIDRRVGVTNEGQPLVQWVTDPAALRLARAGTEAGGWERQAEGDTALPMHRLIQSLLFHGASDHLDPNSGLRYLDQSWRLRPVVGAGQSSAYREEVVLVARTAPVREQAETVAREGGAPTRLWLGQLPGKGSARPPVSGILTQETYLRVYVPVKIP
jgi:hypothetical protein